MTLKKLVCSAKESSASFSLEVNFHISCFILILFPPQLWF
jgi:hypothetical protein